MQETTIKRPNFISSRIPKIVCLCGSTRFYETFLEQNFQETMRGHIVLTVGFYPHAQDQIHGGMYNVTPEQKTALDELHKRKIDLADEVFVLNVGGYIGESTLSEIRYAYNLGKPLRFLEDVPDVSELLQAILQTNAATAN